MSRPDLLIFTKEPLAGRVKTRLEPAFGAARTVEIAEFLIGATVELAVSCWPGDVYLYVSPAPGHALFRALAARYGVRLAAQAQGDLGEKMWRGLRAGIARAGAAAILGGDVPHCPAEALRRAAGGLARGRAVIGPARDGGYYFIGMRRAPRPLFRGITWGGRRVLDDTLARARRLGIEFETLPRLRDADTPDDLRAIARCYEPIRRFL